MPLTDRIVERMIPSLAPLVGATTIDPGYVELISEVGCEEWWISLNQESIGDDRFVGVLEEGYEGVVRHHLPQLLQPVHNVLAWNKCECIDHANELSNGRFRQGLPSTM